MRKTAIGILLLVSMSAAAKIKLSQLFTDNMVLQQQTEMPVWGEATPRRTVTITTSWNGKKYEVKSDAQGKWSAVISTPQAGGPYDISISDGTPLTLHDVMIGEVWLCSGQSNMEFPVEGWNVKINEDEIARAEENTNIRLLQVEKHTSLSPQESFTTAHGGWAKCTPASLHNFSGVAFFFGRRIAQDRGVPVGLIMTCWGGTNIEAWTSAESLGQIPAFRAELSRIASLKNNADELAEFHQKAVREWALNIGKKEGSIDAENRVLWAQTDFDDADWKHMTLPALMEDAGLKGFDGHVWFRHEIDIPKAWTGKALTLSLGKIDDDDITYYNGIEVGHTDGPNAMRRYEIPAKWVKGGKAVITVRCVDYGSGGGIWGNPADLFIASVSDAQHPLSLAGSWRYKAATPLSAIAEHPVRLDNNPNVPACLFNAMLKPLVPFAIKGVIWYQGEANVDRAKQYRDLMPNLIHNWRAEWKSDFPFLIVQLANYMKRKDMPTESRWAELREAQLMATAVDKTGMAVTIDIGDANDIHPTNKQEVGCRLSLAARHIAYGEDIVCSGPLMSNYTIEHGQISITFDHADKGLKAVGLNGVLKGFAVAGVDHVFHWADARIEGNRVIVSSDEVPMPVAARYAWADNPECNLYNGEGLPASPFRTDQW